MTQSPLRARLRKVGLELEFPVVSRSTGRGLGQSSVQALWEAFAERDTSWSLVRESISPVVTGLRRRLGNFNEHVDTDAGVCTVEIALAPQETVGQAVESARSVMSDLQSLLWAKGYTLLSAGIQPITWFDPRRRTQRDWYFLLSRRLHFHHWFIPVASHQVSIDVSPCEAVRVVNMLCGLSGVFAALTASSPIARGVVQPWKETRNWIWHNRLTRVSEREAEYSSNGIPMRPFKDLGDYIEHSWNSNLYLLTDMKSQGYEVLGGRSFSEFVLADAPVPVRRWDGKRLELIPQLEMLDRIHQYGWLAGKLHYRFGSGASLEQVRRALILGEIGAFCEENLIGCYVENRTCGVSPFGEEGATAALTLGFIEMLDEVELLIQARQWKCWRSLWLQTSQKGLDLDSPRTLRVVHRLLQLARTGLQARGAGEEKHLDPLFDRLDSRTVPADKMIQAFSRGGLRTFMKEFQLEA